MSAVEHACMIKKTQRSAATQLVDQPVHSLVITKTMNRPVNKNQLSQSMITGKPRGHTTHLSAPAVQWTVSTREPQFWRLNFFGVVSEPRKPSEALLVR